MTRFERRLGSLSAFQEMLEARPETMNSKHIDAVAELIRQRGTVKLDRFGETPVSVLGTNYREDIRALDTPMRAFAILDLVDKATKMDCKAKLLCLEGVTPFARLLKKLYPRAICSEFYPDGEEQVSHSSIPAEERKLWLPFALRRKPLGTVITERDQIPHVDVMNMTFEDGEFDVVLSADVFEHVPKLDQALSESARVLRPNGAMIATFPFACGQQNSIRRASIIEGNIHHFMDPEYHGDPVRPGEGILVFEIPGWDIIDRSIAAGFKYAEMIYLFDPDRGYVSNTLDGLFILCAQR